MFCVHFCSCFPVPFLPFFSGSNLKSNLHDPLPQSYYGTTVCKTSFTPTVGTTSPSFFPLSFSHKSKSNFWFSSPNWRIKAPFFLLSLFRKRFTRRKKDWPRTCPSGSQCQKKPLFQVNNVLFPTFPCTWYKSSTFWQKSKRKNNVMGKMSLSIKV